MSHKGRRCVLLDSRVRIRLRPKIMKLRIAHGTLLLTLVGTAAFAADIYRSTAPDGTVSYSDRPQGADSEFVYAATPRIARTVPGTAPAARAAAAPEAPSAPTLPDGRSAAELREQRQKNCATAREVLDRYTLSRRLFQIGRASGR